MSLDNNPWGHLQSAVDPGLKRNQRHELVDVLVIALCGFLAGCDGWIDVALLGRAKRKRPEHFLGLPNGIPSHDPFGRVSAPLDPDQLVGVLQHFVQSVTSSLRGETVAIDGKTLACSGEGTDKRALHLVSAWATQQGVVLGQVATAEHADEITAIPALLQILDVRGATVPIDAVGRQKEIARQVREQGADYVLAVQDNQENLHGPSRRAKRARRRFRPRRLPVNAFGRQPRRCPTGGEVGS